MSVNPANANVQPLGTEELNLIDRVLRRIHEQFRAFVEGLPPRARSASGLARLLKVDRTTCQRLVFIASRPYTGLDMLERLPGVRGLGRLVEAARQADPPVGADVLGPLEGAINRLEETLAVLGESQAALMRRIAATSPVAMAGESDPLELRRQLFHSAAALTGRCSDAWVAVYAYHPSPDSEGDPIIDVARVHGLIGHRAKLDAVPLTFHNFGAEESRRAAGFRNIGEGPAGVLPRFTTDPVPVISSKQPGEYLVQGIDTDFAGAERTIDLMLGTINSIQYPPGNPSGIEEVWAMINFPVRRMVFDVYLHREYAHACIPTLDVHLWRPDFANREGDRWQTRFSDGPQLELLGRGIGRADNPAYARHAELTAYLFKKRALDPDEFVGFRCAVEYPIWRTGYCMSFDFSSASATEDRPDMAR